MRVKLVPPPPEDLAGLESAQRAVPLVPRPEADCCARLQNALDLESRDVARTWLTFLRGLGLVREGRDGFLRTRWQPTRRALEIGLLDGVLGAREVAAHLSADPLSPERAFETIETHVPRWERSKAHDWRSAWRQRTAHLLGWMVLAGIAERVEGDFVRA